LRAKKISLKNCRFIFYSFFIGLFRETTNFFALLFFFGSLIFSQFLFVLAKKRNTFALAAAIKGQLGIYLSFSQVTQLNWWRSAEDGMNQN
jgi:hypothetical protein